MTIDNSLPPKLSDEDIKALAEYFELLIEIEREIEK
jgi:cytochrome c553